MVVYSVENTVYSASARMVFTRGEMESTGGEETLFHSLSWTFDVEKNWTNVILPLSFCEYE